MRQVQFWKPHTLFLIVPILLGLLLASAQAQPAAGKAKVDRLVMGLIEKYRDYWRPWINGSPDHMIQHDPVFEWLVEVAPDGQYKPWLADSWEIAKDGRSWHIKLHKGVQFQHGYGEFTAKDVVHSHALWCDEHYPGRKDPPYVGYKNGICQVERVEVLNDYEIVMHCKVVCLDWPFYYSSASTVVIFSKAQWEKEGEMAYETHPAGTGPYLFIERQPDRYVLYERAPTPHWKWGVVDWKELQMTWTTEEPTRLAQFFAGETHLTELNKVINREELRKVLYKGRATYTYVAGYYPDLPGWDPTWEQRFPEMYGYDPAAAKRLLAQAGYPKGFTMKAWLYPFAGAPELIPLMESVQVQLREVGIELELEEADLVATITPKRRERKTNWYLSPGVPSKKAVEAQVSLFNASKGLAHWFEDDTIYKMWEDLLQIADPKAYDEQLRKIGNYKFDNFEIIPLFDVYIEIVVNPKIIKDWPFSGWDGGDMGHTFLISACQQETPCN